MERCSERERKTNRRREALALAFFSTERGDSVCQRPQSLPILIKTMILTRHTKNTTWHLALNPGMPYPRRHKSISGKKENNTEQIMKKQIQQRFMTTCKMPMHTRKPWWHLHFKGWIWFMRYLSILVSVVVYGTQFVKADSNVLQWTGARTAWFFLKCESHIFSQGIEITMLSGVSHKISMSF